jgi:Arc/MetJ-type ribon-helix-helix transcriptional regulator
MQITISQSVQQRIDTLMSTGDFKSVSELIETALDALGISESESDEYLAYVQREVGIGLQEEEQGLLEPFDVKEIIAECRANAGLPPSAL